MSAPFHNLPRHRTRKSKKLDGIGQAHPPSDLRSEILDEGGMISIEPVPHIKNVHSHLVKPVLAGNRIGSRQVYDRIAGCTGLRREDVIAPVRHHYPGPEAQAPMTEFETYVPSQRRDSRQRF